MSSMFNFLKGRLIAVRLVLLAVSIALIAIGIISIYSVGHPAEEGQSNLQSSLATHWQKQLQFTVIGLIAFIVVNIAGYKRLGRISYWLFSVILVLLGVLLIDRYLFDLPDSVISAINNSHRWIKIPGAGLSIQPSEFCKIFYILALAWYLRFRSNYAKFSNLIGPFALTLLPMVLILLEPDLGTVLLMMPILFTMLFVAGAKVKHLAIVVVMALAVSPILWGQMNGYQRLRISSVLLQNEWVQEKAEQYPRVGHILVGGNFSSRRWRNEWGYHLIRSKYALASGELRGYGFGHGPFIKYNFLPERHNDFIFAVIAHQWGFVGAVGVLLLYVILIWCGLEIAIHNTDPFARLLVIGIVTMFTVEVLINVSMTMGLMPITGLTLPLVSYGGSSLMVSFIAIGLLNNVGRHRPFSVAPKAFERSS